MRVEHGPRFGTPQQTTYYGDWHTGRDGYQHRRIFTLTVDTLYVSRRINIDGRPANPLLPRTATKWSVVVTQHSSVNGADPLVLADHTVASGRAALNLLWEAMRQAVKDGYADRADLDRVPQPVH